MQIESLDRVDRGILFLLQEDARHATTTAMAEKLDVSASTIRNRIERLEAGGVIRGYHPDIDYDRAGLQLHVLLICSVPNPERQRLAEQALDVHGVVQLQEVLNGDENLQIEVVGTETDDLADIMDELSELGIEIVNSKILKNTNVRPFDHFGRDVVRDD